VSTDVGVQVSSLAPIEQRAVNLYAAFLYILLINQFILRRILMNCYFEALEVLDKLYDKDTVIPPATVNGGKANLRFVNAYQRQSILHHNLCIKQ